MKVLQKAEQQNFRIDIPFYTSQELLWLENDGIITKIDEDYFCIFAVNCSSIKVVYSEKYCIYCTVVTLKNTKPPKYLDEDYIFVQL